MIEFSERDAGLGIGAARTRVDAHRFHRRQVDHETAIADGTAGNVMATTAHCKEQSVIARNVYSTHDIGDTGATDDDGRSEVDHRVPDVACLLVTRLTGLQYLPADRAFQVIDRMICRIVHGRPPRTGEHKPKINSCHLS